LIAGSNWGNDKYFIATSLLNPMAKKFLKFGQHLAKLLTKNIVGVF